MYCNQTEILTRKGFKKLGEIDSNAKILVKNPNSGKSGWSFCQGIEKEHYTGEIHYFKTRYWDSPRFTPHTNLWTTTIKQNLGGIDSMTDRCEKVNYSSVWKKHIVLDHKIKLDKKNNPEYINIGKFDYRMLDLYYWLGIVATDGHLSKRDPVIIITQCKDKNITEIERVMNNLFQNRWRKYQYDRVTSAISYFNIQNKNLYDWTFRKIRRIKKERRLIDLYDEHPRLLNQFMIGALLGDGWHNIVGNNVGLFCGQSSDLAKDYQVIMGMLNRRSNITIKDQRGKTTQIPTKTGFQTITSKNLMYKLSIHLEGASTVQRQHHTSETYQGNVYKPKTKDGLIYLRRDGMAFWSG